MIFSLMMFFAWLAQEVGAPQLLGGFTDGLALVTSLRSSRLAFFLATGHSLLMKIVSGNDENHVHNVSHCCRKVG
jgi:hypothetical protein